MLNGISDREKLRGPSTFLDRVVPAGNDWLRTQDTEDEFCPPQSHINSPTPDANQYCQMAEAMLEVSNEQFNETFGYEDDFARLVVYEVGRNSFLSIQSTFLGVLCAAILVASCFCWITGGRMSRNRASKGIPYHRQHGVAELLGTTGYALSPAHEPSSA